LYLQRSRTISIETVWQAVYSSIRNKKLMLALINTKIIKITKFQRGKVITLQNLKHK